MNVFPPIGSIVRLRSDHYVYDMKGNYALTKGNDRGFVLFTREDAKYGHHQVELHLESSSFTGKATVDLNEVEMICPTGTLTLKQARHAPYHRKCRRCPEQLSCLSRR